MPGQVTIPYRGLLTSALVFAETMLLAQPSIEWQVCLGGSGFDKGKAIRQTSDGGYILSCTTNSNDGVMVPGFGAADIWVVKLDAQGSILWQQRFGGDGDDWAETIQETGDGGFIVLSTLWDQSDQNIHILKLSALGGIEWQRTLGGTSNDQAGGLLQTPNGGYLIIGTASSNNGDISCQQGAYDIWLVQLDSTGNTLWQQCLGGSLGDIGYDVIASNDGGVVVLGQSYSVDGDVDTGCVLDYWVVKLDNDGSILWQHCYGSSFGATPTAIRATDDGGYAVTGITASDDGDAAGCPGPYDIWLIKLDGYGLLQWQQCLGSTSVWDAAGTLEPLPNGGYIAVGTVWANDGDVSGHQGLVDAWVVSLNGNGNVVWQRCLGGTGSDEAHDVQLTADGGSVIAGTSNSSDGDVSGNHGATDVWVVKLAPEATFIGERTEGILLVSPNPGKPPFTITLPDQQAARMLRIRDATARTVHIQSLPPGADRFTLDMEPSATGLYVVEVELLDGRKLVERLIVP